MLTIVSAVVGVIAMFFAVTFGVAISQEKKEESVYIGFASVLLFICSQVIGAYA